jgi:hypothetical protein
VIFNAEPRIFITSSSSVFGPIRYTRALGMRAEANCFRRLDLTGL